MIPFLGLRANKKRLHEQPQAIIGNGAAVVKGYKFCFGGSATGFFTFIGASLSVYVLENVDIKA
jgi:hypothetical protein